MTKLYIPPYRVEWVPRPDLIVRLNSGLLRKLILVSAPPGFGKTTLLCEWIQYIKNIEGLKARTSFAWLSLDENDNDPNRFLAYITRALQLVYPWGHKEDLTEPGFEQSLPTQTILNRLINTIDERQQSGLEDSRIVLVLDDYHVITAEPVHQCLVYLLDHLPQNMNLVIATRADPPLSLARRRARGDVLELRASELRFSKDEAREFLIRVMNLDLSDVDVAALANRTEGWITGLQMTALALQDENRKRKVEGFTSISNDRLSPLVKGLTGTNRYIMDYLIEEVLQSQPNPVHAFLLKTSILERMCASLCAAVLQTDELKSLEYSSSDQTLQIASLSTCQQILDYLDRANLFIVPLDDQQEWYRYHQLFADLLRKRLNHAFSSQVADLHRRASEWFEKNGALEEAVEHALATTDAKRAADLITNAAEGLMSHSEFETMRRWLDRLPDEQIATRPKLCVFHAWTLFLNNSPIKRIEERLAFIRAYDEAQAIKAMPLRAYIAAFKGLMPQASVYARQALKELPEDEIFLRSMAQIVLASCELSEGDPEAGYRALEQAARLGNQTGNILVSVVALASLAENYRKQGQLHKAESLYQQALDLSIDSRGKRLPIAGRALCGLGDLMREWNRLETAERYLEEGIELLEDWGALAVYSGYVSLARLKQAQNNLPEAMGIIQKIRRFAAQTKVTLIDDWIVDMSQAAMWIAHGDLEYAETWAERRELLQEPNLTNPSESESFAFAHLRKYELIVLARLRLAQQRFEEVLHLLDSLIPEVIKMSRLGLRIEIEILRALTLDALDRKAEAYTTLKTALTLAEPAGFLRIFLDEGIPMYRLLSEAYRQNPSSPYIPSLLAAFERESSLEFKDTPEYGTKMSLGDHFEPLSQRELKVLSLLRSRLTAPEIAEELFIAESTLRSHVKSIYSKLSVHRRIDAIQRAEEIGLLPRML